MRYRVFGVPIDGITMDETVARCVTLIEERRSAQHVVLNVIKVVLCDSDARLREMVSGCPVINADGQYFVWAARALGAVIPERVTGIDLMARLLAEAESREWPVFFLGATAEVLAAFEDRVRERYPGLEVAGSHDGYFSNDESVADAVRASGARLVLVAMPSPRKETFAGEQRDRIGPALVVGVGGAFDVWAGVARRAPVWMQRLGLEWLFRFLQEPRRMWRRLAVNGARFTWLFLGELLSGRRAVPVEED